MWSAFMNGSGMHGGGGAGGGGYVPSQGWEFVPCSGMDRADRGRGKSRSPSRRISSPPTVFSHTYDPQQLGASPGAGDGGAGTQLEILRGQMWPGLEPLQQQQQQTQHARLKKKFEDLKKRHVQDKEEWMREKESLLREVADIQGGENRRILLELKGVLEEVQVEVKREEEKRSELQLQYTRDRCAWELEKAELKCRIAQLEAREGAGFIGVQSAAGSGSAASRGAPRPHGEAAALRREREEQRRLLADTHSTAMDLRCRLEHNERGWLREKAELLERFDVERREWESQLKDMQRKIEVLYCDVRTKRGVKAGGRPDDGGEAHGLSLRSTSAASSRLSDNEPLSSSSSSRSEPVGHPPLPGFVCRDGHRSGCLCGYDAGGQLPQKDRSRPELLEEFSSRGAWRRDSAAAGKEAADTTEPGAVFGGAPQRKDSNGHGNSVRVRPEERPLWAELSYGSDKKKNTTALNAALKEIARVSEELCSYQDEIRKKSGDKRNRSESLSLSEGSDKTRLQVDEAPCDLGQIYDDLRALERENWITLSPKNTWRPDGGPSKSWISDFADPESHRDTQMTGLLSEIDAAGPPIPPRSSSWTLSSPTFPDTELHIPESPVMTARTCHSPCALVDKTCSSPSIVRKFEAMLQENEGKVLIDGVVASGAVPASSDCVNKGCCHTRWSCDASKFTSSKLSTYGTVQKSFSEVNIMTAAKGSRSDYCPGVGSLRSPELQIPPIVKELPLDLLLSSLETPPAGSDLQGSRRNIMLEQKTAEFNRTLFQAEMGRGVEKRSGCTVTDAGSQPVFPPTEILPPREKTFQPLCTDVTTEITLSLSTSNSTIQIPEVQSRRTEGQEVRLKQGIPSDLSSDQPRTTITSQSLEVKHKGQTASGPSRKAQSRATAEVLVSEPSSVDAPSFQKENPHGAKPQPAGVGVSVQQPSAEKKHRQRTPPRHASVLPPQPDSSRAGPRMMNEHPWKALTLAAYPRPEGSRSNYGAVERILKNYESAARAHQNQSQPNEMDCSSQPAESVPKPDMPDIDPLALPPTLRHAQTSNATPAQLSRHAVTELHLTVEETGVTSASSSVQKNFSRPARPARRRLPSRWAGRSPTSSSSSVSSSSSATPGAPPSFALHKHSSSFSYSHAFHIETVII